MILKISSSTINKYYDKILESDNVRKFFCLFMVLLCISSVCFASGEIQETADYSFKTLRGTVIEAGEVYEESAGYDTFKYQDVKVYIKDQGYTTTKMMKYSISYYSDIMITNEPLKKGDKVYVYTTFENGKITNTEISYKNNNGYLLTIVLLYAGAIVVIGRSKRRQSVNKFNNNSTCSI